MEIPLENHMETLEAELDKNSEELSKPKSVKWLLAPNCYKYLQKGFSYGNFLGAHPYVWSKKENRARLGSWWQQLMWKCNMSIAAVHAIFVLGRVAYVRQSSDEKFSKNQKIYMTFMGFFWFLALAVHVGVMLNFSRYPYYTNLCLDYAGKMEKKYGRPTGKICLTTKLSGLFMKVVYYSFLVLTTLLVTFVFLTPGSPEQLTALHPSPDSLSIPIRFLNALFMLYLEILYHSSGYLAVYLIITGVSYVIVLLNELDPSTAQATNDELRQTRTVLRTYKQLRICNLLYNLVIGDFIFFMAKYMLMIIFVVCFYGAVKMSGIQAFIFVIMGIFSFIFLIANITIMAEVHSRSGRIREMWRRDWRMSLRNLLYRKSVGALRDINVVIGGMYYADHGLVLTVTGILLAQTVNFLVVNS